MLELISPSNDIVTVWIGKNSVEVPKNTTAVAAYMLHAEELYSRTTQISGAKRAPLCMMGVCFECLLEVDGNENTLGCMVQVEDGMRIERQTGLKRL